MDTKIDIGVKYADKQARHFDDEKIKAGQCVIGLQVTMIGDKVVLRASTWTDVFRLMFVCSFTYTVSASVLEEYRDSAFFLQSFISPAVKQSWHAETRRYIAALE